MHMTDYLEAALINHVLRNTPYIVPATLYVGLCTADPGETGSIANEVTGGGYARQAISFDAPTGGVTQNSLDVVFPQATADWGTITHVIIADAATAGNVLFYGALTASKQILVGDIFKIPAGSLTITFD